MAIYAVYGLYAAGCLATTCNLVRRGLNLSFFSNPTFTGAIKDFADSQAKKMGLEKEIVIIQEQRDGYCSFGNTWFPGKVGIKVPKDEEVDYYSEFKITHQIAHIKANDHLIIFGSALAAALFTTFALAVNRDLFTRYLGGLGVGIITSVVLRKKSERKADLTAMHYCSKDVNQACLSGLQRAKNDGRDRGFRGWISFFVKPSLDEKIGYFQAHIQQAL